MIAYGKAVPSLVLDIYSVSLFLKQYKIKHILPLESSNHTPCYLLKRNENVSTQKTCTQMFIEALVIIGKPWKQPRCPSISEWTDPPHPDNGMTFSTERKWLTRHEKPCKKPNACYKIREANLQRLLTDYSNYVIFGERQNYRSQVRGKGRKSRQSPEGF